MSLMRTTTIAAIVTAVGLASFSPAIASGPRGGDAASSFHRMHPGAHHHAERHVEKRGGQRHEARARGGFGGQLLALVCSDRGAGTLDANFARLGKRLTLTPEQTTLFDALKTDALTAQTSFADACKAGRPAAGATPNYVERMQARLTLDKARVDAMTALLPKVEAFYGALTADQQKLLEPGKRMGKRQGFEGRKDRPQRPGVPAAPVPAPAPSAPTNG